MHVLRLILCFIAIIPMAATAEDAVRRLSVTGIGEIETAPDMATITMGVSHQAETATAALAETSTVTAQILARLEAAGIDGRDMQTSQLNLYPVMSSRSGLTSGAPKIVGFRASNMVTVRVRDLTGLGGILDAVARDGANEFRGLSFGLQDPDPIMDQARAAAVADAMHRAGVLAGAAGVTLGPLVTMSEGGSRGAYPVVMDQLESARISTAVPVASGELTVRAEVAMVFEIGE